MVSLPPGLRKAIMNLKGEAFHSSECEHTLISRSAGLQRPPPGIFISAEFSIDIYRISWYDGKDKRKNPKKFSENEIFPAESGLME